MRSRLAAVLGALLLLLAGCRADATVAVDVERDGNGIVTVTVVLDAAAAARTVDQQGPLPTDDLRATGWSVDEPVRSPDGSVTLRASKPFAHPGLLAGVVAEVAGSNGPLRDVRLEPSVVEGGTGWSFAGAFDPTGGLTAFTDPDLAEAFGGTPLGQSVEAWSAEAGVPVDAAAGLTVTVDLPGEVETHDGVLAPGTSTVSWSTTLDGSPKGFSATSFAADTPPTAFRWLIVVGVVGLLAAVGWVVAARRPPGRRPGDAPPPARPRRAPAARPSPSAPSPQEPPAAPPLVTRPAPRRPAAVRRNAIVLALDGGLLEARDLADDALAPFLGASGIDVDRAALARRLDARLVGRIDSSTFWRSVGIAGDPAELDGSFAATLAPAPHVEDFLLTARERGTPVVVAGDGTAAWTARFRRRLDRDGLVVGWVLSEDVGARSLDPALLLLAADATGGAPSTVTVVAGSVALLDVARTLGFRTVQYDPRPDAPPSEHALLTTFRRVAAGS